LIETANNDSMDLFSDSRNHRTAGEVEEYLCEDDTTMTTPTRTGDATSSLRSNASSKRRVKTASRLTFSSNQGVSSRLVVQTEEKQERKCLALFVPWSPYYKTWWGFTVAAAVLTVFSETFAIAFQPGGEVPVNGSDIIEYALMGFFTIDIFVNFNLAYYDAQDEIVTNRKLIARHYLEWFFWVDFIGVFPFYEVALAAAGQIGQNTRLSQYLSLLRLFRMVRLHRVKVLFDILQYSTKISFMSLTLIRNLSFALVWTHFNACALYFIARERDFDPTTTWIGGEYPDLNLAERYVVSLYWSVVTFATVGYGDFSPKNSAEQLWTIVYMFLNMIFMAWVLGSITLLIVKNDERTGVYRDNLHKLQLYSDTHDFDEKLRKQLKRQIKLDFTNSDVADEQVLTHLPSALRRKVLRRLYLRSLIQTSLMKDIRQQMLDAFLGSCKVEIFNPGEELIMRGSIASDLYLLVDGTVELLPLGFSTANNSMFDDSTRHTDYEPSIVGSTVRANRTNGVRQVNSGEFINEIGFFTESPQMDTVRTVTVCKTLTMSRVRYKALSEDHPGSVGRILRNLLVKVEELAAESGKSTAETGKSSPGNNFSSREDDIQQAMSSAQTVAALNSIQDLVKMHISKLKDDHTTRFLFAASRGDNSTISLMCDQGFDPNSADYDNRTALMVAAMKGNVDVVSKLLDYQANPNLVDVHGSTALYEAVRNGHEQVMNVLLKHNASLCMGVSLAASTLCQTVFDGDVLQLRRLLRAGIQVNAGDYDKRTAAHIAASGGNVAALKVLVEFGADLLAKDRWNTSAIDDAKKHDGSNLTEYLRTLAHISDA